MAVKKVHFSERVLVLIEEKFKTQAEPAKARIVWRESRVSVEPVGHRLANGPQV